jgi:hypothetical protein
MDLAATCNGKITKDMLKAIVGQACKLNMAIYTVMIPTNKAYDAMDWVHTESSNITQVEQETIWKSAELIENDNSWIPRLIFDNDIDKPYCYVLLTRDIKKYKGSPYPTWQDLKDGKWNEGLLAVDIGLKDNDK